MPPRLPKCCRKQGCGKATTEQHGYCVAHASLASWGRHQQQRGKNPYNNARWRNLRKQVIKRDHGMCQACLRKDLIRVGTDCDHIKPVSKGGDMWDINNIELLCRQCHQEKTGRE